MRQPRSGPGKKQGRGPRIPATTLRKQQAALANVDQIRGAKIPKSFVFSRGKLPSTLRHLQQDLRKVMLPYTALNLMVHPYPYALLAYTSDWRVNELVRLLTSWNFAVFRLKQFGKRRSGTS
ncbi:unnamed protein product [Urochloa humidicola]